MGIKNVKDMTLEEAYRHYMKHNKIICVEHGTFKIVDVEGE